MLEANADLREYWYPVSLEQHIDHKPIGLYLLGEPIVLFRSGVEIVCLEDKCAHRSAPLSIGQVINGNLECKYHGWQYAADGKVVMIPAKLPDRPIPSNAKARVFPVAIKEGLVWVFPGKTPGPVPELRPGVEKGWSASFDAAIDLDIDHSLMVENLLDPAHLPFTHDGTISKRSKQRPLEMTPKTDHGQSIYGDCDQGGTKTRFEFIAPCHIRLKHEIKPGWSFEQTMHCIPIRPGHMRLIYRHERSFLKWLEALPGMNWYNRYFSTKIVFQDYELLHGQQLRLNQKGKPWNSPIQVDQLPKVYRNWFKKTRGWFNGYGDMEDMMTDGCTGCGNIDDFPEYRYSKQKGVNSSCYEPSSSLMIPAWLFLIPIGIMTMMSLYK
jgi:phenylpropionate dioxygenase-like ring-hydroxylating dioxygenase large terminal subunit